MVVITPTYSMFWGITVDGGKTYTQSVQKSFHLSMAALEPSDDADQKQCVCLMLKNVDSEFLLCTLKQRSTYQVPLDLNFSEEEEISFCLTGKGTVHLTGYLLDEDPPFEMDNFDEPSSEEDDESEDDIPTLQSSRGLEDEDQSDFEEEKLRTSTAKAKKRKQELGIKQNNKLNKKAKKEEVQEESDSGEDENENGNESLVYRNISVTDSNHSNTDSTGSYTQDLVGADPQNVKVAKNKIQKPTQQKSTTSDAKQDTTANKASNEKADTQEPAMKKKKKKKKKPKEKSTDEESKSPQQSEKKPKPSKQVLKGGLTALDVKVGHGPEAKSGKMAHMYYTGKLKSGKVFDSCKVGKPFKFKLGKGEVIQGWDIGVAGMKVGGKRQLVIPAELAYGKKGAPPDIPPNSSLVFDVELKAVS